MDPSKWGRIDMVESGKKPRASVRGAIVSSGLARGTLTNAIITGITRLLFFVVIPVLIMNVLISLAHNDLSPQAPLFAAGAEQIRTYMILIGIPLSIVAGLWSYHLRHTKARLYFGLLASVLLAAYGAALLLTPAFDDILTALGWRFPPLLVFAIICYRALRNALRFIRDYYFFSERAKKREAAEGKVPAIKPELGLGEFTPKIGNKSSAASKGEKFIKSTVTFLPFWLIFVIWFISLLGFGHTVNQDKFLDVLTAMAALFLIVGIPMTALALLTGFYPKGTISHTACDLANSLLFILLIYWIFVASGLVDLITDNGLLLPLTPIIAAILIWAFVDVLRVGAEFRDERRNWKKSVGYDVPPKRKKHFQIPPESKWYDFNPSIGKFSRGTIDAKKDVLRFVTIPELLILLTLGALQSSGATGGVYDILKTWSVSILVFGLLIAFISFWRGYFPPGTYSRLLIGLLLLPALALYFRGIGLGGTLDEALKELGVVLPIPEILLLIIIGIIFIGILQFAELGDYRRAWKIAVGKKVKPYKPIKKMNRLQEFRIRFASKHNGAVWARKGIVRYVYYTSIAIIIVITIVNSLIYTGIGVDLSNLSNGLNSIFVQLIVIAIPLAMCRALYGFYPGGSTSKLFSGFLMGVAGAIYTYTAFKGGKIMVTGEWGTVKAGIQIDFGFVVNAFLIGWCIWCLFVIVEYLSYRKAWVANDYRPVESAEGDERIQLEKIISKEEKRLTKLDKRAKKRAARRAKKKGTTIAEEEEREVAAKEAGVKIEDEVAEEEADEAREKAEGDEEGSKDEDDDSEDDEVEADLKEEIGAKELGANIEQAKLTQELKETKEENK